MQPHAVYHLLPRAKILRSQARAARVVGFSAAARVQAVVAISKRRDERE
jgi:hypothetical protein